MSETQTRSRLDEFAAQAPPAKGELVPIQSYQMPAERHGALAVEVRRDEGRIRQKIRELAAMAGEEWYYRWPVRNKKERRTDWVEGPSIKLANALIGIYGNCRVYPAQVVDQGTHWRVTAVFIDFENGAEYGRDFQQRKSSGRMGDDAERNFDIAFQIGESKALRNVVVNYLQIYADFAVSEAKQALVDKVAGDIDRYRRVISERVAAHVDIGRVEAVVGRPVKEWLAPDISRIIAMGKACDDGMASWNDSFPPLKAETPDSALDQFAADSTSDPNPPLPNDVEKAAGAKASAAAPAVKGARLEAIDKMLTLATDPEVDLEDRLANLDQLMPVWEDQLRSPAFLKTLFDTAARVAKQTITPREARDYLEQLP